jgi:predicted RNase H-like HicB family nuclease
MSSSSKLAAEVEKMRHKVGLQSSEEGYSVSVPGLPGCWSQGETEAEALENIRSAIEEYLAVQGELIAREELREVKVSA